jgi:Rod binding domain-containing protein
MTPLDFSSLYAQDAYTRARNSQLQSRTQTAAARVASETGTGSGQKDRIDRSSRLYQVSQEFEAIFIKQMLNTMRKTVTKSGLLDGGMAEEIFEDMLYDEYAMKMAKTAGFGLADQVYLQLTGNGTRGV